MACLRAGDGRLCGARFHDRILFYGGDTVWNRCAVAERSAALEVKRSRLADARNQGRYDRRGAAVVLDLLVSQISNLKSEF